MQKLVHIASDHAGFELKAALSAHLAALGRDVRDHGASDAQSCDYPVYADILCREVLASGEPGILICGSGLGMSMMANRFRGIRAAVCVNEFLARTARLHNNANVLCLGSRVLGAALAFAVAETFLQTPFEEGGRHRRRTDMLDAARTP
jgi:ribose 5-phosphate isomerase B